MQRSLALPPLSLYVHIPWCVRKCPYCDFNSHQAASSDIPEQAYIEALFRDLQQHQQDIQQRRLQSIFFGGGTPSLFSAAAIGQIIEQAERIIGFETDIEITLEANPGTIEHGNFSDYALAGVNRISLGVQSFNSQHLQQLGRIHSAQDAIFCLQTLADSGINNFNIDLMHGLPGQSPDQALADLQTALSFDPSHLSWYQLTLEPNTVFYKHPPTLPEEDQLAAIQDAGLALLEQAGMQQYEVSAFAKTGQASRHNLNYWQFGDYIGIGAGAHSKLTYPEKDAIVRLQKSRLPSDYMQPKGELARNRHPIPKAQLPGEFFMNALRLKQGVNSQLLQQRCGLSLAEVQPTWEQLAQRGLVNIDPATLRTTPLGFQFLNTVLEAF